MSATLLKAEWRTFDEVIVGTTNRHLRFLHTILIAGCNTMPPNRRCRRAYRLRNAAQYIFHWKRAGMTEDEREKREQEERSRGRAPSVHKNNPQRPG